MVARKSSSGNNASALDLRAILPILQALKRGDFSNRAPEDLAGAEGQVAKALNDLIDMHQALVTDLSEMSSAIQNGSMDKRIARNRRRGGWLDSIVSMNAIADALASHANDIVNVVSAVSEGNLNRKMALNGGGVGMTGDYRRHAEAVNDMVERLHALGSEVTQVVRALGVDGELGKRMRVRDASGAWKDLTEAVDLLSSNLTSQVRSISGVAAAVTKGDYSKSVQFETQGELAVLRDNVNEMIASLAASITINEQQNWLKSNLATFAEMLHGQRDLTTVSQLVVSELARAIDAQFGAFYLVEKFGNNPRLRLSGTYAYRKQGSVEDGFMMGEGLIGQCALEKRQIELKSVPSDYFQVNSGLGQSIPSHVLISPILHENEVKGVVEFGSFHEFTEIERGLLSSVLDTLGTIILRIQARERTEELLVQSQRLTEELQNQQEELQQTNEELEEKAREVSQQKEEVDRKNVEIEKARRDLFEKAQELALTAKYKSDFLANMSHELRTPLNSLLILSQQLVENPGSNLTEKQVEHANIIFESGRDLLSLINEVLDLAKVESGTMPTDIADVSLGSVQRRLEQGFKAEAEEKGLIYRSDFPDELPGSIRTDEKRLMQILRNLISNAIKFTETGEISLLVRRVSDGWPPTSKALNNSDSVFAFSVSDTGIGVEARQQKLIFEAFHQVEGGNSRRYGGTGLGLSISREIAHFLGGDLVVESVVGQGSTFTLFLPERWQSSETQTILAGFGVDTPSLRPPIRSTPSRAKPQDDRDALGSRQRKLLIVDDDTSFAGIVMEMAQKKGFDVLIATTGAEGLELARKHVPDAITLDLQLPDMHGWVVLDQLKHSSELRHIPVHVLSVEERLERALQIGAIDVMTKPVSARALEDSISRIAKFIGRKERRLLVVEDDAVQRNSIIELIGDEDVVTEGVEDGEAALKALRRKTFDCLVLDLKLPGMTGFELIQAIRDDEALAKTPIVVYTGQELSQREEAQLRQLTGSIIVKDARSPERLLDETALFLHRVEANLSERKQKILRELYQSDPTLAGKKILIIDDDARNIFAATTILERYDIQVVHAESGQEGIEILEASDNIDAILMDIMMPEMDGYEAIRRIRANNRFESLPIIALTAKAMPEDRSKCIDAGASDYIIKPVDAPQLISLLRVWLYNSR